MKLFVCYARVDKPLCKQIVRQLEAVHDVWYDRRIHAGQDWWQTVHKRLRWCEGFIYLLSPESIVSEYCQREFSVAQEAHKHIFPVIIQSDAIMPAELRQYHHADLSNGLEELITLMNAIHVAEIDDLRNSHHIRATQETQPLQHLSASESLAQAADAFEDGQFDNAVFILKNALDKKPTGIVQRLMREMLAEAEKELGRQSRQREAEREYQPIKELIKRDSTRAIGCEGFKEFQLTYPDYDPDDLASVCMQTHAKTSQVPSILPAPFTWVTVQTGSAQLQPVTWTEDESKWGYLRQATTFDVPAFEISKYPITNAQYNVFMAVGGYHEPYFWTDLGWETRQYYNITAPLHWDTPGFNHPEQPVIGVSWHEVVAFATWLRVVTEESIALPSEAQWQRAAQGNDGRRYPWGNNWNASYCNTREQGYNRPTPVTFFEGRCDSPFGVIDCAGNVWEWCLTNYETGENRRTGSHKHFRVMRGGAWHLAKDSAQTTFRFGAYPHFRSFSPIGFRIVCLREPLPPIQW